MAHSSPLGEGPGSKGQCRCWAGCHQTQGKGKLKPFIFVSSRAWFSPKLFDGLVFALLIPQVPLLIRTIHPRLLSLRRHHATWRVFFN